MNSNLLFCVIIDMINSILFLSEYAYITAVYEELQVINAGIPFHVTVHVTVHSVLSNVAKIHSRLPAAMEFWLVCLGIVVCEQ